MKWPVKTGMVAARRAAAVVLLALAGLGLSSCLNAQERTVVKYDAARDEFQLLTLMQNITAENGTDLEFLAAIYRNRDNYVASLLPSTMLTRMMPRSLLRISPHEMVALNFYGARPLSLSTIQTTIPLDMVEITPGTFFLKKNTRGVAGVGFYQGAKVPGKAVDVVLEEFSKKMQEAVPIVFLQAEAGRRALGGKEGSWVELKEKVMAAITVPMPKGAGKARQFAADIPLDNESLDKLIEAIKARSLHVDREKQVFRVDIPLSTRDSAGIVDVMTEGMKRMDAVIAENEGKAEVADDVEMWKSIREIAGMVHIEKGGAGLRISLDVVEQANKGEEMQHRLAVAAAKRAAEKGGEKPKVEKGSTMDVAAFLRGQGIPIDDSITPESIERDFAAGSLKGYPSDKPVAPGKGITGGFTKP